MRTRFVKKIQIDRWNLPYKWMDSLISNGKIGGVMLVYVEGFTETEINTKVRLIKDFCTGLKNKDFTKGGE